MERAMLERELAFLQGNLHHYLTHWPDGQEAWRPTPDAYTLIDLGAHLYGLPATAAAVLRGAPDEEIVRITGGPYTAKGPGDLAALLDSGMEQLRSLLEGLSNEEFRSRSFRWPFGDPVSAQAHLFMTITHIYHHRGQLHLYLKQLGRPVNTDTIFTA